MLVRHDIGRILATISNPAQAFDDWMSRDAGFARWLETQVTPYNMPWLKVDGSFTLAAAVAYTVRHFQPQARDKR